MYIGKSGRDVCARVKGHISYCTRGVGSLLTPCLKLRSTGLHNKALHLLSRSAHLPELSTHPASPQETYNTKSPENRQIYLGFSPYLTAFFLRIKEKRFSLYYSV